MSGKKKLNPEERARAMVFKRRLEGLKKKCSELSTLCGIDVVMLCPDAGGEKGNASSTRLWPPSESEALRILTRYRNLSEEDQKETRKRRKVAAAPTSPSAEGTATVNAPLPTSCGHVFLPSQTTTTPAVLDCFPSFLGQTTDPRFGLEDGSSTAPGTESWFQLPPLIPPTHQTVPAEDAVADTMPVSSTPSWSWEDPFAPSSPATHFEPDTYPPSSGFWPIEYFHSILQQ